MSKTQQISDLAQAIRRRKTSFWGRDYMVTPRLVDWIEGDGLKVITFTPLATRPDRYVVRIDSKNDMKGDSFLDGTLERIYEAIEIEFGEAEEDWDHDNGRTYHRHNDWPALNSSCGCAWNHFLTLHQRDSRTEKVIREEIAKTVRKHRNQSKDSPRRSTN